MRGPKGTLSAGRARCLALTIVAVAVLAAPCVAQPAGPQTSTAAPRAASLVGSPAVEQGKRFLHAVTTADDAAFLLTLHDLYPTSKLSDAAWLDIRPNWRQFQFHGIERADATHAALSVFDANRDGWALILVTVQPDPPYAITDFALHNGHRPADVPAPPRLAPPQLVAATEAKIADEVAAGRFAGAVLIAQNGRPLFAKAYGMANLAGGAPNTLHTQFRIGSMNKGFTEVAVLQLAQAGKLDLKAPLARYLPDYPNREAAAKITIDELLTHSSGLGDFFGADFEAHRDALRDPKDYVAFFGARPLLFEPGSRQAYSNYGYIVLGRVIEAVSGVSYDAYVQAHVYGPAHMTATGARPEAEAMPNRAIGYETDQGRLRPATTFQVYRGTPAGGGYSTVGDLLGFANAFMSNRLLNADYTRRLTTTGTTLPNGQVVHYDFSTHTGEGRVYFGHAGSSHGQSADVRIFADGGFVVVVLANRDPPIEAVLENFISDRLP